MLREARTMLKRLSVALACAAAGPLALASPDLAETWGAKAGELQGYTIVLLDTGADDTRDGRRGEYADALGGFAVNAVRLGDWSDEASVAAGFGCIFRSMAEEADLQLTQLQQATGPKQREAALTRLIILFDRAQALSEAAAYAAKDNEATTPGTGTVPCPAAAPQMIEE